MDQLTLRWYGHACFTVTCREFTVAFDPYEDNYVPGFAPLHLQADLVLCSHQHNDHNAAGLVKPITGHQNPFHIIEIPTFHDPEGGRLRGDNIIHVLEVGKLRIAHFGDIRRAARTRLGADSGRRLLYDWAERGEEPD